MDKQGGSSGGDLRTHARLGQQHDQTSHGKESMCCQLAPAGAPVRVGDSASAKDHSPSLPGVSFRRQKATGYITAIICHVNAD
jgi:hypothetical protein